MPVIWQAMHAFNQQHFRHFRNVEVIPVNWTQKFEPHGGQILKP